MYADDIVLLTKGQTRFNYKIWLTGWMDIPYTEKPKCKFEQ